MSERREWWIVDLQDIEGLSFPDAAYRQKKENSIHVREVLPGDDDWEKRYKAVQHTPYEQLATKHAALDEAARFVCDHNGDFNGSVALRKLLENEDD